MQGRWLACDADGALPFPCLRSPSWPYDCPLCTPLRSAAPLLYIGSRHRCLGHWQCGWVSGARQGGGMCSQRFGSACCQPACRYCMHLNHINHPSSATLTSHQLCYAPVLPGSTPTVHPSPCTLHPHSSHKCGAVTEYMRAPPRSRPDNAFRTLMRILSNMKWGVVAAVVLLCMSIILPGAVFLLPQVGGRGLEVMLPQAEVRGAAKMCCSRQVALGVGCVLLLYRGAGK